MKNTIIIIIILIIIGGGYFAYTKYMTDGEEKEYNENMIDKYTTDFIAKDFNKISGDQWQYTLVGNIGGALQYKVFINENLVNKGEPEKGTNFGIPINSKFILDGKNTLRVEYGQHKNWAQYLADSSIDIAVVAVKEGDMISTNINESENVLARVTKSDFQVIAPNAIPVDESSNINSIPEITQEELTQGWYWGETKRPGTPEDWILIQSGTRGAKWAKPE